MAEKVVFDKYYGEKEESSLWPCIRRVANLIVVVFLIAGTVVSISVIMTGSPNPIDYFIPVDPPGANEAIRWSANSGLNLVVENACDDTWAQEFQQSIADWNSTDALNLSARRDSYDYDCSAAFGKLRVCNGNYGNTDWKGINVVFMQNERIVHSVSKLNDFHLKTPEQRLYTMCHELGHGFGLPHTDENHFNRDRGDCMDYTDSPQNNLVPGDFNLNLLVQLYGTPTQPRTEAPPTSTSPAESMPGGSGMDAVGQQTDVFGNGGNDGSSNNNRNKEDEDDKDNEDEEEEEDKDDRLRRFLRGDDDEEEESSDDAPPLANYQRLTRRAEKACKKQRCSYYVGRGFLLHVLKLMV